MAGFGLEGVLDDEVVNVFDTGYDRGCALSLFEPSYVWGQSSVSAIYTIYHRRQRVCFGWDSGFRF